MTRIRQLVATQRHRQRARLRSAGLCAAVTCAAAVLLPGVSGWFIAGSALAGAAGTAAAFAFNTMLPSACIRLLAIARTGGRYGERLASHDAAFRALARIRPELYRGLAAQPPAVALAIATGDAAARMVQDVDALEMHFVRRSDRWGAAAAGVAGLALLLLAPMAAFCVGVIACVLFAAVLQLARLLDRRTHTLPQAQGALKQEIAALFAHAPELTAYGLQDWAAGRIGLHSAELLDTQARATALQGWLEALPAIAAGLAAMAALALAPGGSLPVAALAALTAAATIEGLSALLLALKQRGALCASEARLEALLVTPPRPTDPVRSATPAGAGITLASIPVQLSPLGVLGLVGPSGSGKTTVLERLVGLRAAPRGEILVDGIDINDLPLGALRGRMAFSPQDARLLADTVAGTLRLGSAGATEAQIWSALHDAALDERIAAMPGGLDAWIGENGTRLSGGERRRLSLARAYLRQAPWLLLDEPTEGLDRDTEACVVERLRARLRATGQGAIIVTHRSALLALCTEVASLGPPVRVAVEI